jgi:hypothetical protein
MTDSPRRRMPLGGLEPEEIHRTPVRVTPEAKQAAEEAARATGFTQKHATPPPASQTLVSPLVQSPRQGRRRRMGRTESFTVRLRPQTLADIYALAEELDCQALAEVLERAVELLKRDVAGQRKSS